MVDLWRSGLFDRIDVGWHSSAGGKVLAFTVHERPVIRRWSFHGMTAAFQERMVARSPGPNSILDRSTLHRRIDELRADYRRNGYAHADVRSATTETPDNGVDIDLTVDEGQRFVVGAITFEGLEKGRTTSFAPSSRPTRGRRTRRASRSMARASSEVERRCSLTMPTAE